MCGFDIRPIGAVDLERISGACWENRPTQLHLLATQGILGFAAWDGDRCVGTLHGYRVTLPEFDDRDFPNYGRQRPVSWPLGWPLQVAKEKGLSFAGPVWGHACFHVGYVGPQAKQAERAYFGQGIGRALCEASVRWAKQEGYSAVLAQGGSKAAPEYNVWMGCLPWTTYDKLGFACVMLEEDGRRLPWWAKGESKPEVMQQVQHCLQTGAPMRDLCARTMLRQL